MAGRRRGCRRRGPRPPSAGGGSPPGASLAPTLLNGSGRMFTCRLFSPLPAGRTARRPRLFLASLQRAAELLTCAPCARPRRAQPRARRAPRAWLAPALPRLPGWPWREAQDPGPAFPVRPQVCFIVSMAQEWRGGSSLGKPRLLGGPLPRIWWELCWPRRPLGDT